jgi:kynurenine formamidase
MSMGESGDLKQVRARIEASARRLSNWGRWGAADELGTVNYITEKKRIEAASLVRSGRVFSLAIPFNREGPQPPFERRMNPHLAMLDTGTDLRAGRQADAPEGWGYADDMVIMALQCATQWDALSHVFYDFKMYNDRDCELVGLEGAAKNGISVFHDRMVTRGVLVDIARLHDVDELPADHEITQQDLERALEKQRTELSSGDVLLIRTGNLGRFRKIGSWQGFTHDAEPGVGLDALAWLHEREIAALATDTWAVEVIGHGTTPDTIALPVHAVGIVYMGMPLGEIFDLDALAGDCARDGVYDFLFSAPPLPITGAVGSPINPIAVK